MLFEALPCGERLGTGGGKHHDHWGGQGGTCPHGLVFATRKTSGLSEKGRALLPRFRPFSPLSAAHPGYKKEKGTSKGPPPFDGVPCFIFGGGLGLLLAWLGSPCSFSLCLGSRFFLQVNFPPSMVRPRGGHPFSAFFKMSLRLCCSQYSKNLEFSLPSGNLNAFIGSHVEASTGYPSQWVRNLHPW